MRVSYGREQEAHDYLASRGIPVFIPRHYREDKITGRVELVNAVKNVLFVHSTVNEIKEYIGSPELPFFHHFYYCQTETERRLNVPRIPIAIPDRQMESFMRWFDTDDADKYFRPKEWTCFEGEKVRIIGGDFIGMVGNVVNIAGHRRVGVNISQFGFIATSYIPRNMLEPYDQNKTYRRVWLLSFCRKDHDTGTISSHQERILHSVSDLLTWIEKTRLSTKVFFNNLDEIDRIFKGHAFSRMYDSTDARSSLHLSVVPYDVAQQQSAAYVLYHYGIRGDEFAAILFNDRQEAVSRLERITNTASATDELYWERSYDNLSAPQSCAGVLTLSVTE